LLQQLRVVDIEIVRLVEGSDAMLDRLGSEFAAGFAG
jgi:hypothetical protein